MHIYISLSLSLYIYIYISIAQTGDHHLGAPVGSLREGAVTEALPANNMWNPPSYGTHAPSLPIARSSTARLKFLSADPSTA